MVFQEGEQHSGVGKFRFSDGFLGNPQYISLPYDNYRMSFKINILDADELQNRQITTAIVTCKKVRVLPAKQSFTLKIVLILWCRLERRCLFESLHKQFLVTSQVVHLRVDVWSLSSRHRWVCRDCSQKKRKNKYLWQRLTIQLTPPTRKLDFETNGRKMSMWTCLLRCAAHTNLWTTIFPLNKTGKHGRISILKSSMNQIFLFGSISNQLRKRAEAIPADWAISQKNWIWRKCS